MRLLPLLLLAACWAPSEPEPLRYVVVRGDTLGEIATAHGVTVDQLRAWNGIEGDLIEVDQVLLIHAGSAPPRAASAPRPRPARRPAGTPGPASTDTLTLPDPKPCLDPPTGLADDPGEGLSTVASQGLKPAQVKSAWDAFVPHTTACLPDDFRGSATVQLDLTIGCDGRVTDAQVFSGGGLSREVQDCLADRARYAAFPAHDLPLGEQARVPVRFAWSPPEHARD